MDNYRICGDSQKGKSHETNGSPCQDFHSFIVRADFVVAAVADGLGSSKHSDIASKMAATSTVEYCANSIHKGMSDSSIIATIKSAFDGANFAIKQKAGDFLDNYDTTLTLAIFMGGEVYFGHAGDSGIIALRNDGVFEQVTEPQLGSGYGKERPVYPLASEAHWVFGKYKHHAKALFLMTDGVLNKVIPPLLEDQEYKLDHAYLYYLYDNLNKNTNLNNWIKTEVASILPQEINYDDKTLVAVTCNTVKMTLQSKKYYEFPTKKLWNSLLEKHNKELYAYKNNKILPPTNGKMLPQITRIVSGHRKRTGNKKRHLRSTQKNKLTFNFHQIIIVLVIGILLGMIVTFAVISVINNANTEDASDKSPQESILTQEPAHDAQLVGRVQMDNLNPRIGDTMTGSLMDGNNTGILSYCWKANGEVVGETENYTVKVSDLGKRITLHISSNTESGTIKSVTTSAVKKKTVTETPSAPVILVKTYDSVILKPNKEYEFSKDGTFWQKENVFIELSAETNYSFYQRTAETNDTEASDKSIASPVKTNSAPIQSSSKPEDETKETIDLTTVESEPSSAAPTE